MSKAFEVKGVVKHFGEVKALDGVTLEAEESRIFALLGPNGAGKTTLVNMLSTLLQPDRGSLKVAGFDVAEHPEKVRSLIGLAGQFAAVDEFLTGMENLVMVGRLYHLSAKVAKKRAQEILQRLRLNEAANRTVKTYSGGMRRRLDLGASLVGQPNILFLDEPTTGLDPRTRLDMWGIIRELVASGATILLTTQYMEEADELADKITVLDRGKVIAEGTSDELKDKLGGDVIEFTLADVSDKQKALAAAKKVSQKEPQFDENNLSVTVPVKNGSIVLLDLVRALDEAKLNVKSLALHRPSLDDVFLTLTGEKASVVAKPGARHNSKVGT